MSGVDGVDGAKQQQIKAAAAGEPCYLTYRTVNMPVPLSYSHLHLALDTYDRYDISDLPHTVATLDKLALVSGLDKLIIITRPLSGARP